VSDEFQVYQVSGPVTLWQ